MATTREAAAVETLERLGYAYNGDCWVPPRRFINVWREADAMYDLLATLEANLSRLVETRSDRAQLEKVGRALEAYEGRRWGAGPARTLVAELFKPDVEQRTGGG